MLICPGDNFHHKSPSFYTTSFYLIPANMKLSLALVTVLATFAVALPQNNKGQKGQAAQAKGQGNNAAAAAGDAAAADAAAADGVNAKANNGADVSTIWITCTIQT